MNTYIHVCYPSAASGRERDRAGGFQSASLLGCWRLSPPPPQSACRFDDRHPKSQHWSCRRLELARHKQGRTKDCTAQLATTMACIFVSLLSWTGPGIATVPFFSISWCCFIMMIEDAELSLACVHMSQRSGKLDISLCVYVSGPRPRPLTALFRKKKKKKGVPNRKVL